MGKEEVKVYSKKYNIVNALFFILAVAIMGLYFSGKYLSVPQEYALVILSVLTVIIYAYIRINYLNPFNKLRKAINSPENNGKDEVESFIESYRLMQKHIDSATGFIRKIEKGNLEEAETETADNELGASLLSMKEHLKRISAEEKERIWISEGLAKFSELLRAGNADIDALGLKVLSFLTKYIQANQGALFIIQDQDSEEYLELAACYAYDKKKFLEKKILKGQGLAGRAWIEQDTIYLTKVPQNYVEITSGLGNATPSCILIVPLKVNDKVYGVLELASFSLIPKYQKEFIEKLAESLASTISMVKVNGQTRRLLEESQQMTEQMRSQEEEMRQNLEELSATQEELQRKEVELDRKLQEALKEIELGQIKQQMDEIALQRENSIDSSKRDLKFLSNVPPVQGLVRAMANNNFDSVSNSGYDDWFERMDIIFRNFLINKELFQSITFTNETGKAIYELSFRGKDLGETQSDGFDYRDQEIFINTSKLKKGEVYVGHIRVLADKSMIMEFGIPVFSESKVFKGTILVNLFAKTIIDGIKSKEDGEHTFGLFNSAGTCIYGKGMRPDSPGLKKQVVINSKQDLSLTIMHQ